MQMKQVTQLQEWMTTQLQEWTNEEISQTPAIYQNKTHDWKKINRTYTRRNDLDEYVTIGNIYITSEMYMTNSESIENEEAEIKVNHHYNLWPRMERKVQFTLTQSEQQSIVLPKTHVHIMLTQLNEASYSPFFIAATAASSKSIYNPKTKRRTEYLSNLSPSSVTSTI